MKVAIAVAAAVMFALVFYMCSTPSFLWRAGAAWGAMNRRTEIHK